MRCFRVGRFLSLGLGLGIVSVGIFYHGTLPTVPKPFQANLSEFRSLAEVDLAASSSEADFNRNTTVLVQFDSDDNDSNQLVLPATDEKTATDLKISSALEAEQRSVNTPIQSDKVNQARGGEMELIEQELHELQQIQSGGPQLKAPLATTDQVTAEPSSTVEPARMYQVVGSAWEKNPFAGNNPTAQADNDASLIESINIKRKLESAVAVAKPSSNFDSATQSQTKNQAQQMQLSQAEPKTQPVDLKPVDTGISNEVQSLIEIKAPAKNQSTSKTLANETVVDPAIQPAVESNAQDFSTDQVLPGDQYSIAPLEVGVSESVAQRAAHHIEYGKTLSRRGATYAARQEFYSALRVLAQANDAKTGANEFTAALRKGIMSLNEADDFQVTDTESQIGLDVSHVIETHRSEILTQVEAKQITPMEAMQRYFAVAVEQLEMAGGRNVVAAEALYCMGKLHTVIAQHDASPNRLDMAKAIVYHRAALASDQNNFRSANELGVLLARTGQLDEAKSLLKQCLLIKPTPQVWQNLATVHERAGLGGGPNAEKENELAQLAQSEANRMLQMQVTNSGLGEIQWLPGDEFNAAAPLDFHEAIAAKPQDVNPVPAADSPANEKTKSFGEKLKNLF